MRTVAQASPYLVSRPIAIGLAKVLVLLSARIPAVSAAPAEIVRIWAGHGTGSEESGDASVWLYFIVAAALVLGGGAFAGLTIALMGQVGWRMFLRAIGHDLTDYILG